MLHQNDTILLIIFSVMLLVLSLMIVLFIVFNNRKNKLIAQQIQAKQSFEKELAESQVEIREETLRNISWELHDNIGQLITLAKIYLQNSAGNPEKIEESVDIIGKALNEVRALSRSINPESFKKRGLIDSVKNEIERFERMKFIEACFEVRGEVFQIPNKDEIIIFRILQEFFSNTIKHSRATNLDLVFEYEKDNLLIECMDNGVGFELKDNYEGIGLKNMKTRAKLIKAKLNIDSKENKGTKLTIKKKFK